MLIKINIDFYQQKTYNKKGGKYMEFKDRLSELLKQRGISQRKLALSINRNPALITRYLKGDFSPGSDTVELIAEFFNVSIDYLLGKTDDPSTSEDRKLLNAALNNPDAQMSEEVKEALKHGILQNTILLPYLEKLDPAKEISTQIMTSQKRIIVPQEVPLDFATPAIDDALEPEYLKTDILLCRLLQVEQLPAKGIGIFFVNTEGIHRLNDKPEFEKATISEVWIRKFIVSDKFIIISLINPKYDVEGQTIVLPLRKIETEYKLVSTVIGMIRLRKDSEPIKSEES